MFSEPVNVAANDLIVIGLRTAKIPQLTNFSYNTATNTATWNFTGWALADQYVLALSDTVTDVDGNWLDGEWTNPASVTTTNATVSHFPSGNNQPGGWFKFVVTILPGDGNLDNVVVMNPDVSMFGLYYMQSGQGFTHADYSGDGIVDTTDYWIAWARIGINLQSVSLLADFDGDYDVDDADLAVIDQHFGMTGATHATGDLNGDGVVTLADAELAFAQYGLALNAVA